MVSAEEIEKNDFNLNLPRYIDSQQAEEKDHRQGVEALVEIWSV